MPYGSMDVLDSVQNVVTALRSEGNSGANSVKYGVH